MQSSIVLLVSLLARTPTEPVESRHNMVEVVAFDCEHADRSEKKWPMSAGISRWNAGGPAGTAWNVDRLRCTVELRTECTAGDGVLELRVGSHLLRSSRLRFDAQRPLALLHDFVLRRSEWGKGLDRPRGRFPYRTGLFRATAYLTACPGADEGIGFFISEKNFVAGFSRGE